MVQAQSWLAVECCWGGPLLCPRLNRSKLVERGMCFLIKLALVTVLWLFSVLELRESSHVSGERAFSHEVNFWRGFHCYVYVFVLVCREMLCDSSTQSRRSSWQQTSIGNSSTSFSEPLAGPRQQLPPAPKHCGKWKYGWVFDSFKLRDL